MLILLKKKQKKTYFLFGTLSGDVLKRKESDEEKKGMLEFVLKVKNVN